MHNRVKSLPGHQAGKCFNDICVQEERECDGILRLRADPYEFEVNGVLDYRWVCDGVFALLEEEV